MSVAADPGRIEEPGRQLPDLVPAPPDEAALRQPIELARQPAATITAREGQIAGMAARIARMQRELHGSRPEKGKGSNAPPDSKDGSATGRKRTRPGGRPGRSPAAAGR